MGPGVCWCARLAGCACWVCRMIAGGCGGLLTTRTVTFGCVAEGACIVEGCLQRAALPWNTSSWRRCERDEHKVCCIVGLIDIDVCRPTRAPGVMLAATWQSKQLVLQSWFGFSHTCRLGLVWQVSSYTMRVLRCTLNRLATGPVPLAQHQQENRS